MLIATPLIVKSYVEEIPSGTYRTIPQMRQELAERHGADMTCPLTAGIFTRIVSEAALDELHSGASDITPFWRVVDPKSPLAKKISCGPQYISERRDGER
jgi:hypothetical protein